MLAITFSFEVVVETLCSSRALLGSKCWPPSSNAHTPASTLSLHQAAPRSALHQHTLSCTARWPKRAFGTDTSLNELLWLLICHSMGLIQSFACSCTFVLAGATVAEQACACRLRQLVRRLEASVGVRPWPKAVTSPEAAAQSYRTLYYMGLRKRSTQMTATTLARASNAAVNLNGPVNEFRHLVMSWDDWQDGMDVVVRHLKQKDLPSFVFPAGTASDLHCCCNPTQCCWLLLPQLVLCQ